MPLKFRQKIADGSLETLMNAGKTEKNDSLAHRGQPAWRRTIVGCSPPILKLVDMIGKVAARRTTVLITGETGVGKEVMARAMHMAAHGEQAPFIRVNCAAIPREYMEMELFGKVHNPWPESLENVSRFEQAGSGTLFLDEIGELQPEMQAKLLRVLQEREFQKLGSASTIRLEARVLAASNVDLLSRVRQGRFREDLYYRLHVLPLRVPPLRERVEDIPLLAAHFMQGVAEREGLPPKIFSAEALDCLSKYTWPGNVRELKNAVEAAMIFSDGRDRLVPSDFALGPPTYAEPEEASTGLYLHLPEEGVDFEAVMARIELNLLKQALARSSGNKTMAADMLKLKRTTLAAKLKSLSAQTGEAQSPGTR